MITRWIVANVTKRIVIATLAGICNKDDYSWQLEYVNVFNKPIDAKGHLSLWEYEIKKVK